MFCLMGGVVLWLLGASLTEAAELTAIACFSVIGLNNKFTVFYVKY